MIDRERDLIERHEDKRPHAYRDTVGKLTGGVGRNLEDVAFSDDEIDLMYANDLARAHAACGAIFGLAFTLAAGARQSALVDMAFNLGQGRLAQFTHMVEAVKRGDWDGAAREALASRWASQVGARAREDADLLRTGVWPAPTGHALP